MVLEHGHFLRDKGKEDAEGGPCPGNAGGAPASDTGPGGKKFWTAKVSPASGRATPTGALWTWRYLV